MRSARAFLFTFLHVHVWCVAARFLAAKPVIDDVEAFRLRVREAERNVSKIETAVAAVAANYTGIRTEANARNSTVSGNYASVDRLSLHVAESKAGLDSDVASQKELTAVAAEVLKASAAIKEKAKGGATPQNVTRVETLEKKLWAATDPAEPESIDKFKEKLTETEAALSKLETNMHTEVRSLIYSNRTLERKIGKMARDLRKMHEIHLSLT